MKRDPESAHAYADAKRALAPVYSGDRDAYQREKGKVVEKLLDAVVKPPATDTERVLREQAEYYRARAPEYDQWWFREGRYDRGLTAQWLADAATVAEALRVFAPRGRVLELACGTGIWSEQLLPFAADLMALDASPEMLALNAARLGAPANVRYVEAELFRWEPTERFDVVFFGFWLSHVPPERFEKFWDLVRRCLAPDGRVFFVDSRREETSTAADHRLPPASSHTMQRRLNDGREFEIVKIFYDSQQLAERLSGCGWQFNIATRSATSSTATARARRGSDRMRTLLSLVLWCLLFVVCWPLALLALVLWPVAWLVSLPFRLIGVTVDAVFALLRAVLYLPARLLGYRGAR